MARRKNKRLERNTYYLSLAHIVSNRGSCPRAQVGCVLVHKNRVVGTGYNSSHQGTAHCDDVGCLPDNDGKCQRTIHAEVSAVLSMDNPHSALLAYVTHEPCMHCYKIMSAANVKHIYYLNPHRLEWNQRQNYNELKASIGIPCEKVKVEISYDVKEEE